VLKVMKKKNVTVTEERLMEVVEHIIWKGEDAGVRKKTQDLPTPMRSVEWVILFNRFLTV
jgi:hypothetical protein